MTPKANVHNRGLTLIELIVVVAIVMILAAVVTTSFSQFRNNKVLDTGVENALSLLAKARGNTLASKNALQYGVHFESAQMILFQGTTYSAGDSNNEVAALDSALEISSGTLNVVFQRLTGKTDQGGAVTVTIRVKSDTTKTKNITINTTGIASAN